MNKIYPWLGNQWKQIQQRKSLDRMPHSLLLSGVKGLGKNIFAQQLARSFLCSQPSGDGMACGECKSCHLIQAGTHPDFYTVELEDSKVIKIDQVRSLCVTLGTKSQLGGYRIAIINPADAMNTNAANSLLKTLEEPGEKTLLILLSSQPASLPATIRSRCQKVNFTIPSAQEAEKWLKEQSEDTNTALLLALAGGAPLQALSYIEENRLQTRGEFIHEFLGLKTGVQNPLQMADKWNKQQPEYCLAWMTSWIMDLIRLKSALNNDSLMNKDHQKHLQPMASELDLKNLFGFLDKLKQCSRQLGTQVNLQLLFEDLFITWIKTR